MPREDAESLLLRVSKNRLDKQLSRKVSVELTLPGGRCCSIYMTSPGPSSLMLSDPALLLLLFSSEMSGLLFHLSARAAASASAEQGYELCLLFTGADRMVICNSVLCF